MRQKKHRLKKYACCESVKENISSTSSGKCEAKIQNKKDIVIREYGLRGTKEIKA